MLIKTSLLGHHCMPQPQVQDTDMGCAPPHTLTPELLPDGSISSSDPSPSSTSSSLYTASYLVRLYARVSMCVRVFMCECVYECVNMCSSHTLHQPKSCRRCTSNSTPPPMPRPSPRVLLQPLLQLLLQRGILSCQFVACGGLHDCDTLVLSVSTLLQSVEGGRARESVLLVSV